MRKFLYTASIFAGMFGLAAAFFIWVPHYVVKSPKLALPLGSCTTEPNGEKIWYPDLSEFVPPGYIEGQRIRSGTWPAICIAGKWQTDKEMAELDEEIEKPKRELLQAAYSRLLTTDESERLIRYGSYIFVTTGQVFRQEEIDQKFRDLLLLQRRFLIDRQASRTAY